MNNDKVKTIYVTYEENKFLDTIKELEPDECCLMIVDQGAVWIAYIDTRWVVIKRIILKELLGYCLDIEKLIKHGIVLDRMPRYNVRFSSNNLEKKSPRKKL